jgi:glutamate synthase (NADPH) small chain
MPGSQREVQNAEEEGVEFVWLSAPARLCREDSVTGVTVQRMRLGSPMRRAGRCPR